MLALQAFEELLKKRGDGSLTDDGNLRVMRLVEACGKKEGGLSKEGLDEIRLAALEGLTEGLESTGDAEGLIERWGKGASGSESRLMGEAGKVLKSLLEADVRGWEVHLGDISICVDRAGTKVSDPASTPR